MSEPLPALCLIAMPGRRRATIELCREAERRGFDGIYVPSPMGNLSMCEALAWQTEKIRFATSIVPIYQRTMIDFCQSAAMMHEVSGGRFSLGIGIAHGPSYVRMGVTPGKPLADTRAFIEKFRAETSFGPLPPIIVAALRKKMVALAGELAEAGAKPEHVTTMTWYLTDKKEYLANLQNIGKVYREVVGRHFPAMAVVQVTALIEDEAKVEIQATAVVPK